MSETDECDVTDYSSSPLVSLSPTFSSSPTHDCDDEPPSDLNRQLRMQIREAMGQLPPLIGRLGAFGCCDIESLAIGIIDGLNPLEDSGDLHGQLTWVMFCVNRLVETLTDYCLRSSGSVLLLFGIFFLPGERRGGEVISSAVGRILGGDCPPFSTLSAVYALVLNELEKGHVPWVEVREESDTIDEHLYAHVMTKIEFDAFLTTVCQPEEDLPPVEILKRIGSRLGEFECD